MPERCGTLHVNRDPDAMALRARNAEECNVGNFVVGTCRQCHGELRKYDAGGLCPRCAKALGTCRCGAPRPAGMTGPCWKCGEE